MEQDDKSRRIHDANVVAASFFGFSILPVAGYQYVVEGGLSFPSILLIPAAVALFFGGIALLSVGRKHDYEDVSLTEMFDGLTEFDGHLSSTVDFYDDSSIVLPEPVLSSVQGTPPPQLAAGSVVQERVVPPHTFSVSPEMQAEIEDNVARTLANLPPLPAKPPVIHRAVATETPSSDISSPPESPTPRDSLEAKPLKEVISELGNEGYIDALLYCLTLSKAGSPDIILSARGPIRGLGARGVPQDDGTTGFNRSDVLKMLRKARGAVSANLQSTNQLSGEGRS